MKQYAEDDFGLDCDFCGHFCRDEFSAGNGNGVEPDQGRIDRCARGKALRVTKSGWFDRMTAISGFGHELNGHQTDLMVDSGATITAINSETASACQDRA